MKNLNKLLFLALITSVFVFACQKENSPDVETQDVFDSNAAKEWYYGTFKKSPEWASSDLKGKKLPDWQHPIVGKIGDNEVIEFPLIKAKTDFAISPSVADRTLTNAEVSRIADAAKSKIVFIKTPGGKILVREIDYIPDYNYLNKKQFDISGISLVGTENNFSGKVDIKKWNGLNISSLIYLDGKPIMKGQGKKVENLHKKNSEIGRTQGEMVCNAIRWCIWQRDCELIINGDQISTICGLEYNTGNCWLEDYCEYVGNDCEMYMIGCEEGPGEVPPPPPCTQQGVDDAVNALTTTSLNIKTEITTTSSSPSSITRDYKWKFAKVANSLGGGITFTSLETGIQEKGNDGWWRFTSLAHTNVSKSGGSFLWDAEVNSLTTYPSVYNIETGGPTNMVVSTAGMQLNWGLHISYTCGVILGHSYPNGVSNNTWLTNDQ